MASAVAAGFLVTGHEASARAVNEAGEDLTRLLRGMAMLKALLAAFAMGAAWWRLRVASSSAWVAGYVVACGAMAAGPGLIWGMEYVRAGALLLHGGLLATVVLLWRDPAVVARLKSVLATRRAARAALALRRERP
jgi:hypothetical protein